MRDSMKVDLLLLFHRSIFRNINKKPIQVFALLFCLGLSGTLLAQSGEEQIKIVMPTDARSFGLTRKSINGSMPEIHWQYSKIQKAQNLSFVREFPDNWCFGGCEI